MASYREGNNHAKAVKRGIVDQRAGQGNSKKATPFVVEFRLGTPVGAFDRSLFLEWRKVGKYRTREIAERFVSRDKVKWPHCVPEYRIINTEEKTP